MSRFPRIDKPCPLSAEEQRAIDGHCDRCDKHVHALTDLNEAERRALLANAAGPICVSYRIPAPRRVGRIGAAIAATLITTSAYAAEPAMSPVAQPPPIGAAPQASDDALLDMDDLVFVGGIDDPQDALMAEDTSVPELPLRTVASASGDDETLDSDLVVVVGGGVSDPADVEWVEEDTLLPTLPMIAARAAPDDDDGKR